MASSASSHAVAKSRHVMPDELLDDRLAVERESTIHELIEQAGQGDLRNVEQNVDVLSETRPAAADKPR